MSDRGITMFLAQHSYLLVSSKSDVAASEMSEMNIVLRSYNLAMLFSL